MSHPFHTIRRFIMLDVRLKDLQRLEKEVLKYEASETPEGKIIFYGDSVFAEQIDRIRQT